MTRRTHKTLLIEAMLRDGKSPSSIARAEGVSRQRVHSIKVRLCQQVRVAQTHLKPSMSEAVEQMRSPLLIHKPVNNRRSRPAWAMDEKQLMIRCVGKRHMLRFTVAQMYWRENMSVTDIATGLSLHPEKIKAIIHRLVAKGAQ